MTYVAPAKINLALHVTGQRDDGYHELDSLVTFATFGDVISLQFDDEWHFSVTGPFAADIPAGPENLAWKAAREFLGLLDDPPRGLRIELEKNLPVASGIGGGSADAAAVLGGVSAMIGFEPAGLDALALSLGADVPVCRLGRPCRVSGIGERLYPAPLPPLPLVLANVGVAVSTPEVFSRLEEKENTPLPPLAVGTSSSPDKWMSLLDLCRNDLTAPAIGLEPEIRICLDALRRTDGCRFARMSGSGATCFGLYQTPQAAKQAARHLAASHPGWWIEATTTIK